MGDEFAEPVGGYHQHLARLDRHGRVVGRLAGQQAELAEEAAPAVHADDAFLRCPAGFHHRHQPVQDHEEVAVPVALGEQDLVRPGRTALAQ